MAQTYKNKATIHGLVDIGTITGIPASMEPQDASNTRSGLSYDLRDRTGARNGVVFYDTLDAATITFVVQASSLSAKATSGGQFNGINPGDKVTFTPSGGSSEPNFWASASPTYWLLISWDSAQSNTDALKYTIQVERSPGIASYDSVA